MLNTRTALTAHDIEVLQEKNAEAGWGFTKGELIQLVREHMVAKLRGDAWTMEAIEFRLEDANFHELCALLREHDYYTAEEWAFEF